MNNYTKIWKYFVPVLQNHKMYLFGFMASFLVGNLSATIIAPIYYKKIIDEATSQVSTELFSFDSLRSLLILLGIVLLVSGIFRRLGSYMLSKFENNAANDVHTYSLKQVLGQSYYFFANNFIGTLSGKLNRLSKNFRSIVETVYFGFILLFFDIAFSLTVLFNEHLQLGFVFLVFLVIFIFFSFSFIKKQSYLNEIRAKKGSKRSGVLSDILTNILNIKIFSSQHYERKYYHESVLDLKKAQLDGWLFQDKIRIYKNILFILFEVSVMGVALYLFSLQKISLGTLVLVQIYTTFIITNIWHLSRSLTSFVENISDTVDAIDVVTTQQDIVDTDTPEICEMNSGEVVFDQVEFAYPEGDKVFKNFSLVIPAGQSVGIVGTSGSGKTTITKLLLRLFDTDSGDILIDSQSIKTVLQDDLRNVISYIPQESILFHRSIYDNISYGDVSASRSQIIDAAKSAHADEFIVNLKDEYDTTVGERGVKLSGGQRQRIAIARAMLKKDAPVLIMDEATSSLDSISEKYIQKSFEELSRNRTTIVIAHRLSTIQKMDRIIVMSKGEIIEDGPHDVLIKNKGHYAQLWSSQNNGFIE